VTEVTTISTDHHGDVTLFSSGGAIGVEREDGALIITAFKSGSYDDRTGAVTLSTGSEWAAATPAEARGLARLLLELAGEVAP
jgi:hypothetical protein